MKKKGSKVRVPFSPLRLQTKLCESLFSIVSYFNQCTRQERRRKNFFYLEYLINILLFIFLNFSFLRKQKKLPYKVKPCLVTKPLSHNWEIAETENKKETLFASLHQHFPLCFRFFSYEPRRDGISSTS